MVEAPAAASAPVSVLVEGAVLELERRNYSPFTVRNYRQTWMRFLSFARGIDASAPFSLRLATSFLDNSGIRLEKAMTSLTSTQCQILTAMRKLEDFAEHGCFQRKRLQIEKKKDLPPALERTLGGYLEFATVQLRSRASTVRVRRRRIRSFLEFLASRKIHELETGIPPQILSDFITSRAALKPVTLAGVASDLRLFLRFLFMREILPVDLSVHVPLIRVWHRDLIPSVWAPEHVDAVLAAVDRSSPVGKRDYAILLLACRLGLRVGDIRTLRLENLRWDEARIDVRQQKTQVPLVLPLSNEVGQALIDYLCHSRPSSEHREVFLRANAPFEPLGESVNFHGLITTYRQRAGIKPTRPGRWGMHSLRHTLATRLLEAGTGLETISEIMGHVSVETTRIYTKVNVAALRSAALDPEEVARD